MAWLKAEVPRTSPLRWTTREAAPTPLQRVVAQFEDEVMLLHHGDRSLRYAIDTPPRMPWGDPARSAVVISPDHRWLWVLHYARGHARVSLFEVESLTCVGTHDPQTLELASRRPYRVEHWGELSWGTCPTLPDRVLIHANVGDDIYLMLALEASPAGILDRGGLPLFDAVASRLDETLWSVAFTAPDRLLVLDDIGILSVLSWPEGERLISYNLTGALRDPDDHTLRLWPGCDDEDLVVGEDIVVIGEHLLLNLCTNDSAFDLRALAVLDRHTLEPLGLLRPPAPRCRSLSQLDAERVVDRRTDACYGLEPA